jgi:hypothetical protein
MSYGRIMSNKSKHEYLEAIRDRYRHATKRGKQRTLDELCQVCGYNRKYAIRLLNAAPPSARTPSQRRAGRVPQYTHPDILRFLKRLWKAGNLPCGKRLKAMIPLWLPFEQSITREARERLQTISAATIDRLLASLRRLHTKCGLATTKPGSLLKKHIPIKTNQWDEHIPGFLEADTVAHCGSSMAGMFAFTLNAVDIATNWSEQRALWGKGERGTLEALTSIEAALPFRMRGFDCDNGSEFLNWTLLAHYTKRKQPVDYTRSREYHKNDNAHVEGKNWTHVRQYLGYERFDDPTIVPLLNDLFTNEWRLLMNFFLPSVKLTDKQRVKSRIIKTYDPPKTPLQRVLESPHVAPLRKRELKSLFPQLNPFLLQQCVNKKIRLIRARASHSRSSTDDKS